MQLATAVEARLVTGATARRRPARRPETSRPKACHVRSLEPSPHTLTESAMLHKIQVRLLGERAWEVGYSGSQNPMVFRSGARAVAAARALPVRLADEGHSAELTITLRDGWIAANFISKPQQPASAHGGLMSLKRLVRQDAFTEDSVRPCLRHDVQSPAAQNICLSCYRSSNSLDPRSRRADHTPLRRVSVRTR